MINYPKNPLSDFSFAYYLVTVNQSTGFASGEHAHDHDAAAHSPPLPKYEVMSEGRELRAEVNVYLWWQGAFT